jgi:hypothetical protein
LGDEFTYSASLTGEAFLFYEIKQIARLKLSGLSNEVMIEEVKTKNLFQYGTETIGLSGIIGSILHQ